MDRESIVKLAKEWEWVGGADGWTFNSYKELERFVDLVRAHERKNISNLIARMPGDTAASIAIYVREL